MPSCREIDPLFAAYVDDQATSDERAMVEAHLRACPKCRHQTALQTIVRDTLRAKICATRAPEHLRARCRAAARTGPWRIPRSPILSLSLAAALVLVAGGVLLYALTSFAPALAAQLTLDHVTCFAVHESNTPIDPAASVQSFAREYGQTVRLPSPAPAGLQLVGMRRCYCGEGPAAHLMYRLNGRPVSLYVIPDATRSRATTDLFGYDAVIWSKEATTYVLVSDQPRATLERLAAELDKGL